jgi:chromatin remodeling complex protein RSC6
LTIEGQLLDPKYKDAVPFACLFKSVTIQVDRKGKYETTTDTYEWVKVQTDLTDNEAVAFQVIIPNSDNGKPFSARISMERAFNSLIPRFEVSDKLLALFPNILLLQNRSVTEDEIMFYIWSYVQTHGLWDGRDNKRFVRCDAALCALFGVENLSIHVHLLKQKLFDSSLALLIPVAPVSKGTTSGASGDAASVVGSGKIDVEYYLTSAYNTSIDPAQDSSCCPVTISRSGGKSFDLEVYVPTSSLLSGADRSGAVDGAGAFAVDGLARLNGATSGPTAREVHHRLDKCYQHCLYMGKQLNDLHRQQLRLRERQERRLLDLILQQHQRCPTGASAEAFPTPPEYLSGLNSGLLGLEPRKISAGSDVNLTDAVLVRFMQASVASTGGSGNASSVLHGLKEYFDIGNDAKVAAVLVGDGSVDSGDI